MALYQGRALSAAPRRPGGRIGRAGVAFAVLIAVVALAHLPWRALARHWVVVGSVRVSGLHYLDEGAVRRVAGIREGQELLAVEPDRVRQRLMREPRIAGAAVHRRWPRGVEIRVEERLPVMLVQHGVPWEIDSSGVLLAPLAEGVVADVPLLTGPRFDAFPAGTQVRTTEVERGLAWMSALSDRALQLGGRVSEVDVSSGEVTALTLMDGTRVLSPAWPPDTRTLSALRVVLADLEQRGTAARELDMRFEHQVIVRPAEPEESPAASPAHRS